MYLRNESKQLQVLTQEDSLKRISVIDSLMARKSLIEKKTVEFIAKDYGSPINQILVSDIYPMNGFQNWDRSNLEIIENIHSAYQDKYPQAMFTKRLELDIKSWKNQLIAFDKFQERVKLYGDFSQKIAIGEKAPDIIMDDVNGKELKLSTLKGQVVLLDFWASWCGPCRKANPQLVALYHTYKDKGFTVYSVSLDNDPIAWKQAIQQDGLAWPNHVSDLMGWKTPMTQLYKFSGIPFTVLIDEKGIIAGINVHPQELEQQLQSMLK
jgi:thiol-disulfide isomerase/thioredoxin